MTYAPRKREVDCLFQVVLRLPRQPDQDIRAQILPFQQGAREEKVLGGMYAVEPPQLFVYSRLQPNRIAVDPRGAVDGDFFRRQRDGSAAV